MRNRFIAMIPGAVVTGLSWLLFWALLIAEVE
jgi:hypothetical protein